MMTVHQREVSAAAVLAELVRIVEPPPGMRIRAAVEPIGRWDHIWFRGEWYGPTSNLPVESMEETDLVLCAAPMQRVMTAPERRWVDSTEPHHEEDVVEFEDGAGAKRYSRLMTEREAESLRRAGR